MSLNINNDGQPVKVLWFGDLVVNSGFGRIGNEVTKRLAQRGWALLGASIPWGAWPPHNLPFPIWGMGGQDIWNKVTTMAQQTQPNVIVCCQDYPYAQTLFHGCRIDWSTTKLIIVTPIDGTPVHPEWIALSRGMADATIVISKFGVAGLRQQGVHADLLYPGVDLDEFKPAESREEVEKLRARVGIARDAFVIGSFMMNQGRKMVSATLEAFKEFALDKPDAVLLLDMDRLSPAGWDIQNLIVQMGIKPEQVMYKEDAVNAGVGDMRDRIVMCDITSQMAHREGFGLPNIESQACKVPPTVLDWCSGTEIADGGKGILIRRLDYMEYGTWGGARDSFPDMADWVNKWNECYHNRDKIQAMAIAGYEWVKILTWDNATNQFEAVLKRVVEEQRKERAKHEPTEPASITIPAPALNDLHGPADTQHHSPDLQPPQPGVRVPGNGGAVGGPDEDGNHRPRRRKPGIQPDAVAVNARSEAAA